MSLDYTSLQTLLLATAHREELTAEAPDFIRLAEGMIRREVLAFETRLTLTESDRVSGGVYTLPDTIQTVRSIYGTANGESYRLENVGMAGIRSLPSTAGVRYYGISGRTIELRGVPGTDAEFEVVGIGWPEPLATTATNSLLTNHEALYLYGALFHLYQNTQDNELAQNALSVFSDAVLKVNRQIEATRGGGSVQPAYNFGHIQTSVRY